MVRKKTHAKHYLPITKVISHHYLILIKRQKKGNKNFSQYKSLEKLKEYINELPYVLLVWYDTTSNAMGSLSLLEST